MINNNSSKEPRARGRDGSGENLGGPKEWVFVSNDWSDGVLLPILYMLKPSCRPMFKPPSLERCRATRSASSRPTKT